MSLPANSLKEIGKILQVDLAKYESLAETNAHNFSEVRISLYKGLHNSRSSNGRIWSRSCKRHMLVATVRAYFASASSVLDVRASLRLSTVSLRITLVQYSNIGC